MMRADEISLADAIAPLLPQLKGHQQTTDAYQLGLTIHMKGKLATLDRSIATLLPDERRQHGFLEIL